MSTSDQNGEAPLTRRKLRELRLTGANPVITPEGVPVVAPEESTPNETKQVAEVVAEEAPEVEQPAAPVIAPFVPLTRRQIREQERLRTASVPVIEEESEELSEEFDDDVDEVVDIAPVSASIAVSGDAETGEGADVDASEAVEAGEFEPSEDADSAEENEDSEEGEASDETDADAAAAAIDEGFDADADSNPQGDENVTGEPEDVELPIVDESFGETVLNAELGAEVPAFEPSFDEIIAADSTGTSGATASSLIFTAPPSDGSLSGPVASTGEILVTGSYELPRGLGSQGHAEGVADGKEVDAVLIDGELPAASSPTPIAASAAVSTVKPAGEIIRPPAPDKGNKVMLMLAIAAGALAVILGGVLIYAFATGIL